MLEPISQLFPAARFPETAVPASRVGHAISSEGESAEIRHWSGHTLLFHVFHVSFHEMARAKMDCACYALHPEQTELHILAHTNAPHLYQTECMDCSS